ncbi:MAG: transglycosylase SLT domain-containing protein [Chitinispirillaceae bacterium]|nr:transglycosylase SLT domain-containing protein [Chitinispirillaceae bacterium]
MSRLNLKKLKLFIRYQHIILFLILSKDIYSSDEAIFPEPPILKNNIAFWKKIYTEVSVREGLLHDRDYLSIVFEKVSGDCNSGAVREAKKRYTDALIKISSMPESTFNDFERTLYNLYLREGGVEALKGAHERIRFQLGQKERFKEGLERSGMYFDTICAILSSYNIPLRVAYLPHVESSFNTEAYSRVGAAGLWQFMRGTAKLYGLRIDYTIDERRDPVKSTIAAAKYLSAAYSEFGNWPLAITSYNHGIAGIRRAIAETGSRDIATIIKKYRSRSFQFASSNFYSCFLAASFIAENYSEFFPDVKLRAPLKYTDFVLEHYIDADNLCRYLNISKDILIALNPALRPAVFSKHQKLPKGYAIHVPADRTVEEFYVAYNKIPDSLKETTPPRPQYYRVNRGDNLYLIASRLGVSVTELAYENNITKVNRLKVGQILRVPAKATITTVTAATTEISASPETSAVAEIARAEGEQIFPLKETSPTLADIEKKKIEERTVEKEEASTKAKTTIASEEKKIPKLEPPLNDSLKEIALAPAIAEQDRSSSGRPKIDTDFDVSIYNLEVSLSPTGNSAKITVSVDETIGHYAEWLGIPTWRIRRLNDMGRSSNIRIHSHILIPIDKPDALEQFVAARLEYHMAIEEDFYYQYIVTDVVPYKLRRGEALWDICNNPDNPIPLWLLKKYNRHLELNQLIPGIELWIPQIRERTQEEKNNFFTKKQSLIPSPPRTITNPKIQQLKLVP